MKRLLFLAGLLSTLTAWPVRAAQTNETVVITITNAPTGTNGEFIIFQGNTYVWTNTSPIIGQLMADTNNRPTWDTTNLFNQLTNDWSSLLRISYSGPTNITIGTYVNGTVTITNSAGWMTFGITTNVAGSGNATSLTESNFNATSSITLNGDTRTNWPAGGTGGATNYPYTAITNAPWAGTNDTTWFDPKGAAPAATNNAAIVRNNNGSKLNLDVTNSTTAVNASGTGTAATTNDSRVLNMGSAGSTFTGTLNGTAMNVSGTLTNNTTGSSASAGVATNGPDGTLISPPTLGYFGLSFRYGFQTFDQPFPVYSMDLRHWAFASRPLSFTPYSTFRDAAIIKYNKQYVLSCTTNVFTTFSETGVPIFVSTNLNDWSLVTNLNFFVAGEVNDTCWAPKFLNYGTNLWIFATCSTNGNISHFIRGMYCPSNNFPFGFTGLFMVTQSETNMIDFSPWYEPSSGKSGAWFKNETTKYVELGEWSNSTPTSIFTNVLTGNFAGFGGNQEAPFMEFIPGGYALLMDDYGGQTINGNANDPGYYQISYSTNIESPSAWSYPSNVDFGGITLPLSFQ